MADITVDNISANSIQTTELNTGNMIVSGKARFVQPIYADLEATKDINTVTTSTTLTNADFVLVSNGTNLRKIPYEDFCADMATHISVTFQNADEVSY